MSERTGSRRRITNGTAWMSLNAIISIAVCLAATLCVCQPRTAHAAGASVDQAQPYEVIVYEGKDFSGAHKSYTVEEGNCQRQSVNLKWEWDKFNDKISSVRVGSKVSVVLFEHANYAGTFVLLNDSTPDLGVRHFNDKVSSLIVLLKENGGPLGVHLIGSHKAFYPIDEKCECVPFCKYEKLVYNDDATKAVIYPIGDRWPAYGKVSVTLQEHTNVPFGYEGNTIALPPPIGPKGGEFDLGRYELGKKASAVTMTVQGDIPKRTATGRPSQPPTETAGGEQPQQIHPYTIVINDQVDFVGSGRMYTIGSGGAQKLMPDLSKEGMNDRISSIRVGSTVAVVLFEHKNYSGNYIVLDNNVRDLKRTRLNNKVSSLIIFLRDVGPLGVQLVGSKSTFYPVDEVGFAVSYRTLIYNDDAQKVYMTLKDPKIRPRGRVKATLFEHTNFEGKSLPLAAAPFSGEYDLEKLNFKKKASSLKVECVAMPPVRPY